MMGTGNPTDWWSMMMMMDANAMHSSQSSTSSSSSQHLYGSSSSSNSLAYNSTQDLPRSWSQLHLGGLGGENEKFGGMMMNYVQNNNPSSSLRPPFDADVKQEFPPQTNNIGRHLAATSASWSHHHQADMSVSSSSASSNCSVSTNFLSNHNVFNFPSSNNTKVKYCKNQLDSYECNNSTSSGGPSKKPRVHHSSSQPSLKVRKEKLGDRITTLHQIVSPFGKTDTASVLSESIGYITFLHSQIQALSAPYMGNNNPSGSMARHSHKQQSNPWLTRGGNKDLRSKGLCLVPVSCIQHVGSEGAGAAGYWAPAKGGGF